MPPCCHDLARARVERMHDNLRLIPFSRSVADRDEDRTVTGKELRTLRQLAAADLDDVLWVAAVGRHAPDTAGALAVEDGAVRVPRRAKRVLRSRQRQRRATLS